MMFHFMKFFPAARIVLFHAEATDGKDRLIHWMVQIMVGKFDRLLGTEDFTFVNRMNFNL
jgi:hypothetical protein